MIEDHSFTCPWCWQNVTMVLDLSDPSQDYVEDCEVCCRPIRIRVQAEAGELLGFEADQLE